MLALLFPFACSTTSETASDTCDQVEQLNGLCEEDSGSTSDTGPVDLTDYFAMEGDREARYRSDDAQITWELVMKNVGAAWTATRSDDGSVVSREYWSTTEDGTVQIDVVTPAGSSSVDSFDGPIAVTGPAATLTPGVPVTTQVVHFRNDDGNEDGVNEGEELEFISTLLTIDGSCPVPWHDGFEDCARLTIEGGNEASKVYAVVGEYTLVRNYWMIEMERANDSAPWQLSDYEYQQ